MDGVNDLVALTFDDGPSAADTPRVLDTLASHGARATFFTLAQNVDRRPELVRRMVAEGHEVAVHGELHLPIPLLPRWLVRREIERSAAAVKRAANITARHYRPPFGLILPSQARFIREMGYETVMWDVYPDDPYQPPVDRIVERVMRKLTAGSILILHDGSPIGAPSRAHTVGALGIILRQMGDRGLRGTSVDGLLEAAIA
jgi:peptidoglycan/xylan/chitin deacetylase (PgdA/CDA1 family)